MKIIDKRETHPTHTYTYTYTYTHTHTQTQKRTRGTKAWDLIIDTWNEYIKKSDGIVNLFFTRKFNVRIPLI